MRNTVQARDSAGELSELMGRYSAIHVDGFSIDLASEPARWDRCMKQSGLKAAYARMAAYLCRIYRERFGEEFLLTESCVAREIQYHADAYLVAKGYKRYSRHVTTLLFSRAALEKHCKEVDISLRDLDNWKQRIMFRYRRGIRDCYRGTDRDPFRRLQSSLNKS